ncbi:hypothetical protein A2U01_0059176, partial [Trifolium medium]|nr:hypothetical protein [Trifolium medium]
MALKASQYIMAAELPESINTRLTSQFNIWTWITSGSSSWRNTLSPSVAENDISGVGGKDTCPTKFVSWIIFLRYRFLAALDSPPPANPPAM